MNKILYLRVVLLVLSLFLQGCASGETVSLQDALVMSESTNMESETQTEGTTATSESLNLIEEQAIVCYVYVCGAVKSPGVYELVEGDRKIRAIELAGGFLETAARESINLAEVIEDGMQITVATVVEQEQLLLEEELEASGLVNINTASKDQLCTLIGIGEAKATDIIEYREAIGQFSRIEELKNISGIGDSLYNSIKDFVYVDG